MRLFIVPPDCIVEHYGEAPEVGVVEAWECYSYDFSDGEVIGPFTPEVTVDDAIGQLCIVPPDSKYPFFFQGGSRPCWMQSGRTLRFILKRRTA